MSDNYLKVIPAEPTLVPPSHLHQKAVEYLERLLPRSDECEARVYDEVTFIDQGSNLEAVICPSCGTRMKIESDDADDLTVSWWDDFDARLSQARADLISTTLPCCGATARATDLIFDWPAGFARFEISVLNPSVGGQLSAAAMADLESILGCKLRQIWAHY